MHDEQAGHTPDSALAELRKKLAAGLARARLNQTQLAAQAHLGRTTVSEALSPRKPVPSAETVAALARVLKLPAGELLELRRTAAAQPGAVTADGPGRPIDQWDPHALEVHPAGTVQDGSGLPERRSLPGYVSREHDRILAEAVQDAAAGHSRMLVLVGGSSTGKTRACWEAVQSLAEQGWRLWHPFDPTRAEAALEDLARVVPRTVVWLNEAQHYLGDQAAGEQIAAAVHRLLISPQRGPVLVLGTLWPDYVQQYTALPAPGGPDQHSRVRELLAGRTVSVPDAFDTRALAAAAALAEGGDRLLADALTRARADGRLTQDLAGGPALLERYRTVSPAAKALLEAAMDARRLGVGLHLPQAFLTDAAADYLHDTDWNQLTDDWAEKAYAELAKQVHGKQAPLSRITPRPQRRPPGPSVSAEAPSLRPAKPVFRLADYLEQHGRTTRRHLCPPASFWHAAHTHLTHLDDLNNLTVAAEVRHRLQWAHHLRLRAADHGSASALTHLAVMWDGTGDWKGAETLARQAADHGNTHALTHLARMREKAGDREAAETLARQAADYGSTDALYQLAVMREGSGDREGAATLARQATDYGSTDALVHLALMREEIGDREAAETFYRQAADYGSINALYRLAVMREADGDREGAAILARQAADRDSTGALTHLAVMREKGGDREGAERLARQVADYDAASALFYLARVREETGDREGAETLYRQAIDHGDTDALFRLARMYEEAGEWEGAAILARQAADHGNTNPLSRLALIREEAGDRETAETLARQAADHGSTSVLFRLAEMREETGNREGAEILYRQAADHGSASALFHLARLREETGDREDAETLYRQAADHGNTEALYLHGMEETLKRLWPFGLDPDGMPTPHWQ
ncbi:tetratricopeptide repeat protein [Streptomyces sp. NPDC085946]|uniref:tetratricopeptide repeat protein n=1 Tax=Streptomyces sp. NPDC085946 TaxID=3365744 RepID=UPI0037CD491A